LDVQLKSTNENADQVIAEAKILMSQQTVKTFTDEMARRGISDYRFHSVSTTAKLEKRVLFTPGFGFTPGRPMPVGQITGTTIIEFDDLPIAIAAIIAAIAVAITAHAGLIVVLGLITIVAVIACVILHTVIVDLTTGVTAVGESIKQATSTTGGSIAVIVIALVVAVVTIVLAVRYLPGILKRKTKGIFY